jgi:glutamyl-tRNA synthetase
MKNNNSRSVRVRFAPSPTGHLHIGGLRTAIFNWLFAKHNNGTFLIRIEDTDRERSKQEYADAILAAFDWIDIHPDESVVIQSERIEEHRAVAQKLLSQGKAYKCYCSSDAIAARADDEPFIKYDGHCRTAGDLDKPYAIRFKLPDFNDIVFEDLIRGPVRFDRDQLDDFIIVRSDGMPVYNFVVVVDDAAMKISHVIRGEDHISNTPKQILLYQACNYTVPQFAHIPMILGPSGDRLSKRDGATSVLEYKNNGYLPNALMNYLVRLGWAHGDQEIFTREELIAFFTLNAVGKKGAIFDIEKLNWVNTVYLKNMAADALLSYIHQELNPDFSTALAPWDREHIVQAINLYKERVATITALMEEIMSLHNGPVTYSKEDIINWTSQDTKEHLATIIDCLQSVDHFTIEACSNAIKNCAKKIGVKFVVFAQPIRIALLGKSTGPGIFELLGILGKKESIKRIQRLREHL